MPALLPVPACSLVHNSISIFFTPNEKMSPLLPIPFLLLVLSTSLLPTYSRTSPADVQSLSLLKLSVDPTSVPPSSCLSSWDFSSDPCDSAFSSSLFTCGIRCDAVDASGFSRVTAVSLDPAGYSGALPSSLWSLPFLTSLELTDNRFSGPIPPPPPSSGLPPLLRTLSLSRNSLAGPIPLLSPAPSLQELYLDNNLFHSHILAKFDKLPSLRRLELQANRIAGTFPNLSMLTSLSYLDASDNDMSGPLSPANLPSNLLQISIRNNSLTGIGDFADLHSLQVLDLSFNRISGPMPGMLFQHPALEQLALAHNLLDVIQEPADGGASSGLVAVDLGYNALAGFLPGFFGSMPRLSAVDLEGNLFTGMIPAEYAMRAVGMEGAAVPFARLLLAGNYLFGPIPSPMETIEEGSAAVSLADNCLFRCPQAFFFCRGLQQKSTSTCREFNPVIP